MAFRVVWGAAWLSRVVFNPYPTSKVHFGALEPPSFCPASRQHGNAKSPSRPIGSPCQELGPAEWSNGSPEPLTNPSFGLDKVRQPFFCTFCITCQVNPLETTSLLSGWRKHQYLKDTQRETKLRNHGACVDTTFPRISQPLSKRF